MHFIILDMDDFVIKLFLYCVIVLSATFHEYAHGWSAYRLGDDTAKLSGRLTLNPLAHIDTFGTVILPLLLLFTSGVFIGWAKPVPYNPYNLRDRHYGSLKVAIAGPLANIIIALVMGALLRLFPSFFLAVGNGDFIQFLALIIYINIVLALFNMIPIPPLDGSKVLADLFPRYASSVYGLGILGMFVALLVAFWLIPPVAGLIFRFITGADVLF